MSEALLQVRDLESGYGGQIVLRGVSIDVPEASLITLIGPNGHGKTTLLRCISGLVRPWSGDILFAGASLVGQRAHQIVKSGILQIPQGDLLFAQMTVFDNLMMGAYLPSAHLQAEQKIKEVFTLLPRLEERKKQMASTLSGGERRMLAIGRGLMANGRMLLIDEPSLGLAPLLIDQIYELIADLKRRGTTILLVEENAGRAMQISDRVYLLDDGKIIWQGEPAEMAANEGILATYLGG
jgi:branched-chain amino acid transport system ATP-binding protein